MDKVHTVVRKNWQRLLTAGTLLAHLFRLSTPFAFFELFSNSVNFRERILIHMIFVHTNANKLCGGRAN